MEWNDTTEPSLSLGDAEDLIWHPDEYWVEGKTENRGRFTCESDGGCIDNGNDTGSSG